MANSGRQLQGELVMADDMVSGSKPSPSNHKDFSLLAHNAGLCEPTNGHANIWSAQERIFRPSSNLSNWQATAKRICDVAFSASAIIALSPLLTIVGLAIVLESRGPVFFLQEREGKNGKPFTAIKFRSMRRDDADVTGVKQTTHGDVRVTKVGRFIRRTSIDELPQLLNVLRGDMSLVGPRPHVKGMLAGGRDYRALVPYYELRLHVMPGLTGLAQANGLRGPTADADLALRRIDYDLDYIENFSIFLDIKIILQTLKREFLGGSGH